MGQRRASGSRRTWLSTTGRHARGFSDLSRAAHVAIHYHMNMETKPDTRKQRVRSTGLIILAAVLVLALAGLTAFAWKTQGRDKEDSSKAMRRLRNHQAVVAESLLPMIDKLEALRGTVAGLRPGDADFEKYYPQLTQLQNLIADQLPALVFSRDADGNATIVGTDMARDHIRSLIKAAQGGD